MQLTSEKTVREIAVENPASIRVFESLGIDYCCGGKTTLRDASSHAAIDMTRVLDLIEKAGSDSQIQDAETWNEKSLAQLIAHIVHNHHDFVRQETPRLDGLLTKVASKHGPAHPEVVQIQQIFAAVGQELSTHMFKEEQVLFPYIARMEQATLSAKPLPPAVFGTVRRPIANMIADHDDAGALLLQIRQLSGNFSAPQGACPTFLALYRGLQEFERDLHRHVHLENNILFPRAIAMEEKN
jgi:regulator of cell morphogenesis and NO signaling